MENLTKLLFTEKTMLKTERSFQAGPIHSAGLMMAMMMTPFSLNRNTMKQRAQLKKTTVKTIRLSFIEKMTSRTEKNSLAGLTH
mgnify:CR=1 FL=1